MFCTPMVNNKFCSFSVANNLNRQWDYIYRPTTKVSGKERRRRTRAGCTVYMSDDLKNDIGFDYLTYTPGYQVKSPFLPERCYYIFMDCLLGSSFCSRLFLLLSIDGFHFDVL